MSRSQQQKIANQGMQQSAQDQGNAMTSFAATNAAIGNFNDFLNQTWGQGGEFQKDSTTMANDVAQAGNASLEDALSRESMRTGENTAGNATAEAEGRRQSARDLTSFNAKQDQTRLAALSAGEEKIPGMYESLYAPSVGGASSNLGPAANAAQAPGFWDWFTQNAIQGAETGAKIAAA